MVEWFGVLINGFSKSLSEAMAGYRSYNIFPEYEVVTCRLRGSSQ
jgi:hypothetical protein